MAATLMLACSNDKSGGHDGDEGVETEVNGTQLDGRKITEAPLPPDGIITIGRTDITFRVIAQASPPRPTTSAADATRAFGIGGLS